MSQSQYATSSDLQALAITPAAATRFGSTSITAALQAASSIADTYLSSQFTLPLVTSPQGWDMALTMNVCWIAAYLLYNQFGYAPMAPGDEMVAKRYQSALDWLVEIRDKKIFPVYTDSATTGQPEQGPFVDSDPPVGFTSRGEDRSDAVWTWNGSFWGWC